MEFNADNTIVYTVLVGQNEGLNSQPLIRNSKLRHVCLTDDENLHSDDWEIWQIDPLFPMDQCRSQRNLKIRPHLLFPEYSYSFYFDNTIVLKCTVEDLINELFLDQIDNAKDPFFILPFLSIRENLISEFYECFICNLDSEIRFFEQISHYLKIDRLALKLKPYWTAMLFRNHKHSKLIELSEIWFSNVLRYTRRDQLSIVYAALQSDCMINGFVLDNHSSVYHDWPVTKNERKFRTTSKNLNEFSHFFEKLLTQLSRTDQEILKIDFDKEIENAFLKYSLGKAKNRNEVMLNKKWCLKLKALKLWGVYVFLRKIYHYLSKKR